MRDRPSSDPWDSKPAIARVFNQTSDSHDSVGTPVFRHFGTLLVRRAELKRGDQVLDVAAGTGATLFPAARAVGKGGRVVGVDLAPGMVAVLNDRIAEQGLGNATALVADAERLPFDDEAFDVVICGFALFFFPDVQAALGEMWRVLRPRGRVAFSTFTRRGSATFERMRALVSSHVDGPPPPAEDHVDYDEPEQLSVALERAGFVDVEIKVSPQDLVLPDLDAWLAWLRTVEFREYVERMDAGTLKRFRRSAERELGAHAGGEIRLPMDALLTLGRRPHRQIHVE